MVVSCFKNTSIKFRIYRCHPVLCSPVEKICITCHKRPRIFLSNTFPSFLQGTNKSYSNFCRKFHTVEDGDRNPVNIFVVILIMAPVEYLTQKMYAEKSACLLTLNAPKRFQNKISPVLTAHLWFCLHCKESPIYVFPETELRGLSPNLHIHLSLSDLYIPRIGPTYFPAAE